LVKGGNKFGDHPAAVHGPNLDYHQNKTAREEFHKEFPKINKETVIHEPQILLGELDTKDDEILVHVMLGVWKSIHPTSDHCSACDLMDARTFGTNHDNCMFLHLVLCCFSFLMVLFPGSHEPRRSWYYYPFHTANEVLVFHQYSNGRFWANPHLSFNNRNCHVESESMISLELRVAPLF